MRLAMILICALFPCSCRRAQAPMPDLFTDTAGARHGLLLQRPLLRPRPVADRGPQSASGIRRHARKKVPRQAVIEPPLSPPFSSAPPRLRVKVHPSNSREPPPDSNYNGRTPCLLPPSPRPPLR